MCCAKCSHNSSTRSVCMYLCSDKSLENKAMCLTLWKLFHDDSRCAVTNKIRMVPRDWGCATAFLCLGMIC